MIEEEKALIKEEYNWQTGSMNSETAEARNLRLGIGSYKFDPLGYVVLNDSNPFAENAAERERKRCIDIFLNRGCHDSDAAVVGRMLNARGS